MNYMQQPMKNLKDISDPTTAIDMTLALMAKAFTLNNTTSANNNQRSSSNPSNMQITQLGIEMLLQHQLRVMVMVSMIAQEKEAGIQITQEEFKYMATVDAYEETERVKANCIFKNNLQQASTFGTQSDKALVYDLDGSAKVYLYENYHDNDIFNMFTQEEQYTELLEPKPEPHQLPQNDSNVILRLLAWNKGVVESDGRRNDVVSILEIVWNLEQMLSLIITSVGDGNDAVSHRDFKRWRQDFQSDGIMDLARTSRRSRLKVALEDSTWRRRHDYNTTPMNPFKASRVDNFVPNKHVKASVRTKPITVSQPHVIIKNDVNSKTNGFSLKDVKNTTKTKRPLPRKTSKNDKVLSKSKSSWLSNNLKKIKENHRNLQSSLNQKHMSSECNNIKLAIRNAKSEIVCAMCKECLITINHDVCVLNYVNGMNSRRKKQKANVSNISNQLKHKAQVWKLKNVGSKERLASPKPSTPRLSLGGHQLEEFLILKEI
uniref:Uncharacterized protein n=1 Tax=Tanacetum cinerariifolium TaxID=118510 RepID=A0A6L2K2K9_TANCI|nr:hypothetical protein [Tanacetum cinerariifolium]